MKWFCFHIATNLVITIACIAWWQRMEMLLILAYRTVPVVHFTDQTWIFKTVYCIRCVMVCKIVFTNWNAKIALLLASMVFTYYIELFLTEADRQNSILISLPLSNRRGNKKLPAGKYFAVSSPRKTYNKLIIMAKIPNN